ncbi:MAG: hypothetical protein C4519_08135 [Desulfobacteraceae bacterium]|nr:MAG: hypothetical protein C4519_08135 [Desulfobacteraceae bacterium]
MTPSATLAMRLPPPAFAGLIPFFSAGVGIQTRAGIALSELLCDQLAIPADYVDQRIQTIFVNGRAVDRVAHIRIAGGDVIALSAALPGLAGATLRKGGVLAVLRKEISHTDTTVQTGPQAKTMVTLKLFNLVAKELCALLLSRGVWVKGKDIAAHLRQGEATSLRGAQDILYNRQPVLPDELPQLCRPEDWVFLSVTSTIAP